MLNKLVLKNFKRHEELEINFSEGFQALRGANEAGKSSIYHAITYAFYGSRALPLSLEETVTWGRPVSSLKVTLVFTCEGAQFTITRSKSGAELVGPGVTASGHAEVTAFVERLFRATAAIGVATMITNQNGLKDSLDKGSMSLIEKLSNMQVIDEIINKIQEKLPSGNTKALEAQLAQYNNMVEPILDVAEAESELIKLTAAQAVLVDAHKKTKAELSVMAVAVAKIQQKSSTAIANEKQKDQLKGQLASLKLVPVPEAPQQSVEALQKAAAEQRKEADIRRAWRSFDALPKLPIQYKSDDFVAEYGAVSASKGRLDTQIGALTVERAELKAKLITSTACGWCGKDLQEVPEVAAANAKLNARIAEIDAAAPALMKQRSEAADKIADMQELNRLCSRREGQASTYVTIDKTVVPFQFVWTGPAVDSADGDAFDYDAEIRRVMAAANAHNTAVLQNNNTTARITQINNQLEALVIDEPTEAEFALVGTYLQLQARLEKEAEAVKAGEKATAAMLAAINEATAAHTAKLSMWQDAMQKRQTLLELISAQHKHNNLIAKLREARPVVAKRLWNLVLTAVSHYFSTIRGTQSTVTRNESGFLIDGKPAEAYSGSTKDSLGLAIRIVLQKTFLSNVDTILVDEPGAAFDDTRESDMLAVLSSCGIRQVVLVTHSDLADSFATNVITI